MLRPVTHHASQGILTADVLLTGASAYALSIHGITTTAHMLWTFGLSALALILAFKIRLEETHRHDVGGTTFLAICTLLGGSFAVAILIVRALHGGIDLEIPAFSAIGL